jgi:HEAT repeat protein
MSAAELAILNRVNADNWAALYRCRWSQPDAQELVPQLRELLESEDPLTTDEALRALFRIGPQAVSAAPEVAILTRSENPITKQLAVLTLGQIAHNVPSLCVEPLALALADPLCCRDAMRSLAFIGSKAIGALDRVLQKFSDPDAKIRKAALVTATAIDTTNPAVAELIDNAFSDRSKNVRDAAAKLKQKVKIG